MKTKISALEVVLEYVQLLHKFWKCQAAFSPLWVSSGLLVSSICCHVDKDEAACSAAWVPDALLLLGPAGLMIMKKKKTWMSPAHRLPLSLKSLLYVKWCVWSSW